MLGHFKGALSQGFQVFWNGNVAINENYVLNQNMFRFIQSLLFISGTLDVYGTDLITDKPVWSLEYLQSFCAISVIDMRLNL